MIKIMRFLLLAGISFFPLAVHTQEIEPHNLNLQEYADSYGDPYNTPDVWRYVQGLGYRKFTQFGAFRKDLWDARPYYLGEYARSGYYDSYDNDYDYGNYRRGNGYHRGHHRGYRGNNRWNRNY